MTLKTVCHRWLTGFSAIGLMLVFPLCSNASSANIALRVAGQYPDYALHLGHNVTSYEYKDIDRDAELRQSWLGITFAASITDALKARFHLGNIGLSLDDSLNGDDFDPTGSYVGFSFETLYPIGDFTSLFLSGRYLYIKSEDDFEQRSIHYRIDEVEFQAGALLHLRDSFSLELGANYLALDGRERFTDDGSRNTLDIENSDSSSVYLRALFHFGRTGHVAVSASGGARDEIAVYFRRAHY